MKKRLTAGALAAVLAISGCSEQVNREIEPLTDITEEDFADALAANSGIKPEERFLIFCWNDEFETYFGDIVNEICSKHGKEAEYFYLNGGEYNENLLDTFKGNSRYYYNAPDNAPDLVLMEADYIRDYFPYITDVSQLGISENDTAQMYEYTKQIATDEKGALKALSWTACSGVFAYRRSIAKELFGDDSPETVREAVKDWESYEKTAKKAAEKGYYITASTAETLRPFTDNKSAPWIQNESLTLDRGLVDWAEMSRRLVSSGACPDYTMWDYEWMNEHTLSGRTLGVFFPSWGVNYCLGTTESFAGYYAEDGDYGVCQPPQYYFWGGTWLGVPEDSKNKEISAEIMRAVTCDTETLVNHGAQQLESVNNRAAMRKLAADSSLESPLLCGQNPFGVYSECAEKINCPNRGAYDMDIEDKFQYAMAEYVSGRENLESALAYFLSEVGYCYGHLSLPEIKDITDVKPIMEEETGWK
ncbi:MAG: extracellular solute-binding protein [Ruminiclostridium sp.]